MGSRAGSFQKAEWALESGKRNGSMTLVLCVAIEHSEHTGQALEKPWKREGNHPKGRFQKRSLGDRRFSELPEMLPRIKTRLLLDRQG